MTVNLQADTATGIGGTFANVTQFFGGTGANTIDGPDAATTWSIFGADFEQLDGSTFFSFGNLIGGTGPDQFAFQPGGSLSGNVDGGGGTNTLDDSGSSSPVTVNLQSDTATGIGGTFANVTNFLGSPGSDTFIGPDAPAVWSITGAGPARSPARRSPRSRTSPAAWRPTRSRSSRAGAWAAMSTAAAGSTR